MESRTCLGFFFIGFLSFLLSSHAYVFTVGGRDGWVVKPSDGYGPWAGRNRFLINDTLVFKYKNGTDSVLVVNKQDYDSCSVSNPILKLEGGDSRYVFDRSGPFYFITGNQSNCQSGQKLVIVVLSPRTKSPTAPPPSTAPGVAPVSHPGNAPSPSPSTAPGLAPVSPPGNAPSPTIAPGLAPVSPPGNAPSPTIAPGLAPVSPPGNAPSPSTAPGPAPVSPPGNAPSPTIAPGLAPASPPGTVPVTVPTASPPGASITPNGADSPGGNGGNTTGGATGDTAPSSSPRLSSSKGFALGLSLLVTLTLGSSLGSY